MRAKIGEMLETLQGKEGSLLARNAAHRHALKMAQLALDDARTWLRILED